METRILLLFIGGILAFSVVNGRPHAKKSKHGHRKEFLSWESRDFWPNEIQNAKEDLNGIVPQNNLVSPGEQKEKTPEKISTPVEKGSQEDGEQKSQPLSADKSDPDTKPTGDNVGEISDNVGEIQKDKNLIPKDVEYDDSKDEFDDEAADEQYDFDDDYDDYDNDFEEEEKVKNWDSDEKDEIIEDKTDEKSTDENEDSDKSSNIEESVSGDDDDDDVDDDIDDEEDVDDEEEEDEEDDDEIDDVDDEEVDDEESDEMEEDEDYDDEDYDEDEEEEEEMTTEKVIEKVNKKSKEKVPEQFSQSSNADKQFDSLPIVAKKKPVVKAKKSKKEVIGAGIDAMLRESPKEPEKVTKVKEIIRTSPNPPTSTATQKVSLRTENDKKEQPHERYIQSIPYMSCQIESDCSPGRSCIDGVCMCGQKNYCQSHSKPVCGSDGILYDSHCELHRTACQSRIHIKIDHKGLCFEKEKDDDTVGFVDDKLKEEEIKPEHKIQLAKTLESDVKLSSLDDDLSENVGVDHKIEQNKIPEKIPELYQDETQKETEEKHKTEIIKDEIIPDNNETPEKQEKVDIIPIENEAQNEVKPEVESEVKPEVESEVKPEVESEVKPEVKSEVKDVAQQDAPAVEPIHIRVGDTGSILEVEKITKPCDVEEFMNFKAKLLKYHCEKYDGKECMEHPSENKLYISTLMFSDFDRNMDSVVTTKELGDIERREDFHKLSEACTLINMITHDDINQDGRLTSDEFCKSFDLPAMILEDTTREVTTLATEGNGLEIKCGVLSDERQENRIIWKRYGVNIKEMNSPELTVFEDGSLYFRYVGIHHIGNYTCMDKDYPFLSQVHILKVQKPPVVEVSSHTKIHGGHADIRMECHADGVPRPKITWKKNEHPLPEEPSHFIHKSNEGVLVIHNPDYHRDTGAYKCSAKNQAGSAHDITTVFIQNPNASHQYAHSRRTKLTSYIVFHSKGYEVYDPEYCNLRRNIDATFSTYRLLPDEIDGAVPPLCVEKQECDWHQAVNVKDKFIYVSQPKQKRVIVIGVEENWDPIEIIKTDESPYDLHYVEHLDQVWMVISAGVDSDEKIVLVIRDASRDTQHHTVHTQPVGDRFDQVDAMFIPGKNDLDHTLRYGYIRHSEQRGLYKLDMEEMNYVGSVDFSYLDCVPQNVAFVPLGGYSILQCVSGIAGSDKNIQLVLDYMTDKLIANFTMSGKPYVSPDSRYVVTADAFSRIIHVVKVSDEGVLSEPTLITVGTFISDVAFFPAANRDGYNLYIRSSEREEVTFVDLEAGTAEKMRWKNFLKTKSAASEDVMLSRMLTAGNVFMEYLVTSVDDAAVIIDGTYNVEHCRFNDLHHPNMVLFTSSDLD